MDKLVTAVVSTDMGLRASGLNVVVLAVVAPLLGGYGPCVARFVCYLQEWPGSSKAVFLTKCGGVVDSASHLYQVSDSAAPKTRL